MILRKTILFFLFCGLLLSSACMRSHPIKAKRVILIGIDALSTDGLQVAKTPNLDQLIREGALSLKARGVMPTVSAPNWGSMLLGAGPEQHGITKNGWKTDFHTIEPTVADSLGYFPSIFEILKKQRPNLKIAAFYDWPALGDLFNHRWLDSIVVTSGFKDTYQKAIPYIINEKPDFAFIYVGHVDEVGHHDGHGSPEYYQSITDVDAQIGQLIAALKQAGMYQETHFIVVSDHGGVGHGHGGESMAEIQVPWIIRGPGIISDRLLESPINTFDTAPTIAYLFNVQQPECWIGRPVLAAFRQLPFSAINRRRYVPKPKASLQSGLYTESQTLTLQCKDSEAVIRYTLDGREPQNDASLYEAPIRLDKSMVVKTASFKEEDRSEIVTVDLKLVKAVKQLKLKYRPSAKYPAKGPYSLVDHQLASTDYTHPAWLGFEKDDLDCLIDLGKVKAVKNIRLRFLKNEDSWIFLPQHIELKAGRRKNHWAIQLSKTAEQIQMSPGRDVHTVTFELNGQSVQFINLKAKNMGYCPEGHPGAGGKAWLFIDEILIE